MQYRTLSDMDVRDKRVILRADFNVPLDDKGGITDDNRIVQALPTIKEILSRQARQLIIMSHLGRPKGKVVQKLRLDPVAKRLSLLLGQYVTKLDDCIGIEIPQARIVMLENLRFHSEEEENYEFFAKKLASYGDIYVNDAFGTCHRAHASVEAIARFLPACAGLLLEKELKYMKKALENPARPFVAIIGGAKISDKIGVINHLLRKVDYLLLGGAMIFTFFKAEGYGIGSSLFEPDKLELARLILNNEKLVLPVDVIVADRKEHGADSRVVDIKSIPDGWYGLDLGPGSVQQFKDITRNAKTVVWNGPLGMFEIEDFAKATNDFARYLAGLDATVIIGGGDSAAALKKLNLQKKVSHVSTGGGASLELLEGKELPAIKALQENIRLFPKP